MENIKTNYLFSIPANALKAVALAAAKKNDCRTALTAMHIDKHGAKCTNSYRIHQFEAVNWDYNDPDTILPENGLLLPIDQLKTGFKKNVWFGKETINDQETGRWVVSDFVKTVTLEPVEATFPSSKQVQDLLNERTKLQGTTEFMVNPQFLMDALKAVKLVQKNTRATFTVGTEKPIFLQTDDGNFTALVMYVRN